MSLPPMLGAMLLLLTAWSVLGALFTGLGALAYRGLGLAWPRPGAGAPLFWCGWAAGVGLLQLWNLALPVDARAVAALGLLGLGGLAGWLRAHRGAFAASARAAAPSAAVLLLFAVWLSQAALAGNLNPDNGAYYVSTVRWLEQFRLPPGLGNLSYPLALNNSYFLYVALLDHGPFFHQAQHVANPLLALGALWPALEGARALFRPGPPRRHAVFAALLLPAVVEQARSSNIAGPVADVCVFFLGARLLLLLVRTLELGAEEGLGAPGGSARVFAVLGAAAVVVKSSLICQAAPVLAAAVLRALRTGEVPPSRRARELAVVAGLGAAWVGPWMLRGVLLSGYPLFPSPVGGMPVPWRLPRPLVESVYRYVRAFARRPGPPPEEVLRDSRWVGHWLSEAWLFNWEFLVPVSLCVLALGVLAWQRRGGWKADPGPSDAWLLWPLLTGLVLWALLAPDLRFAGALPWALVAAPGACVLARARAPDAWKRWGAAALGLVLLAGALSGLPPLWEWRAGMEPLPSPENATFRTRSGLEVRLSVHASCFEALCTALPDERLRLRRPGDPGGGFVLDEGR